MAIARGSINHVVAELDGDAVASANVSVINRATSTPATIYGTESGGGTLPNPVQTDAQGRVPGWLNEGSYRATISGSGISNYTLDFEIVNGNAVKDVDGSRIIASSIPASALANESITDVHLGPALRGRFEAFAASRLTSGIEGNAAGALTFTNSTTVDIAGGTGWINAAGTGYGNGLTWVSWNGTTLSSITHPNATASSFATHQIVARITGYGTAVIERVAPSGSTVISEATALDSRPNAGNLAAGTLLLHDVLTAPTVNVVNTSLRIRDRRRRARGAARFYQRTSGDIPQYTGSTTYVDVDPLLNLRMETTGKPVRVRISGNMSGGNSNGFWLTPGLDGVASPLENGLFFVPGGTLATNRTYCFEYTWPIVSAGSHVFRWQWRVFSTAAQSIVIKAAATTPLTVTVEEVIGPDLQVV